MLGNQYLYYITYYSSNYTLVSEMGNRDTNEIRQQEYTQFYVLSEVSEFKLFSNASSTPLSGLPALSDCLIFAEHTPFSTFDHDSSLDECESGNIHGSGWWFALYVYIYKIKLLETNIKVKTSIPATVR
jgi:hypothetical protein